LSLVPRSPPPNYLDSPLLINQESARCAAVFAPSAGGATLQKESNWRATLANSARSRGRGDTGRQGEFGVGPRPTSCYSARPSAFGRVTRRGLRPACGCGSPLPGVAIGPPARYSLGEGGASLTVMGIHRARTVARGPRRVYPASP